MNISYYRTLLKNLFSAENNQNLVQGPKMNFIVNASPPKPFDIVTANSVGA